MNNLPRGPFTDTIIAVTILAWFLAMITGNAGFAAYGFGFIPALSNPSVDVSGLALEGWRMPSRLTPLTSAFVHGGLMHLAMNMLMMFVTGRMVERALGGWSLVFLYVAGAYAAASAQYFADPLSTTPMVGASGAISAIVGAYAMLFSRSRAKRIGPIPAHYVHAIWMAASWALLNWLSGIAMSVNGTQVAVAAHIGGFLVGLIFARTLLAFRYRNA